MSTIKFSKRIILTLDCTYCKVMLMKTIFQKAIKANRKKLIRDLGYSPSTVHSWEYGIRFPKLETAMKLQLILGIDLDEIPYFQSYRKEAP